jgi:hypothetical protein
VGTTLFLGCLSALCGQLEDFFNKAVIEFLSCGKTQVCLLLTMEHGRASERTLNDSIDETSLKIEGFWK